MAPFLKVVSGNDDESDDDGDDDDENDNNDKDNDDDYENFFYSLLTTILLLDAFSLLYVYVRPSVRRAVRPSVCRSIRLSVRSTVAPPVTQKSNFLKMGKIWTKEHQELCHWKHNSETSTEKNLSNEIEGTFKFVCYRRISLQLI